VHAVLHGYQETESRRPVISDIAVARISLLLFGDGNIEAESPDRYASSPKLRAAAVFTAAFDAGMPVLESRAGNLMVIYILSKKPFLTTSCRTPD
jgi:hypothetical protein